MEDNDDYSDTSSSANFSKIKDSFDGKNISLSSSGIFEDYNLERIGPLNYFICNDCHSIPKIIFNYDNSYNMKCNCIKIENLWSNSEDFKNKFSFQENVEKYLCCKEHILTKYKYYCVHCKIDICEKCFIENHKTHLPTLFTDKKIVKILDSISILIEKTNLNPKIEFIYWDQRKFLIKTLIAEYKEFPCYNLYKSIISANKYLENLNKKEIFNQIITDVTQFNKNKIRFPIIKIDLSKQNIKDLSLFKEFDLKNLKKLILNDNFITNIDPLLNCNFELLEIFELQNNQLNYQSLKDFDKMRFQKIKFINLYINKIESIKIFEKILNFKTLNKFYVGNNKFEKEEIFRNGDKEYDLSFLSNLGITGNFTDETIFFSTKLILTNLETLYVSRNNLSSLDFLKKIKCKKLFKLWAIQNKLIDYNDILKLEYKDNIQIINLEQNKINNIDNLFEFISNFPSLTSLNLSTNEINLDDIKNKAIIEKIKETYENLNLILDNQNNYA